MNKAFEMILERLDAKKQYFQKFYEADGKTEEDEYINKATQLAFDDAKNIVQEVAEEYDNGWIACSDRLPVAKEKRFGNKQKRTDVLVTLRNGVVKEMTYEFATKSFGKQETKIRLSIGKKIIMEMTLRL